MIDETVQDGYTASILQWRKERMERLKLENGWLALDGLHWLKEGEQSIGCADHCDIVLPADFGYPLLGTIVLEGDAIKVDFDAACGASVDGTVVGSRFVRSDEHGAPERIVCGTFTLTFIKRGRLMGLRLHNTNSEARHNFAGIDYYPIDPAYRIEAAFEPFEAPRQFEILNVLGEPEQIVCPGIVAFCLNGVECRLVAQQAGDELFINFRDLTSGDATYPAGRFLYTPLPQDGVVVVDFNQAYTPPCGFTPYATCPLPHPSNHLKVKVEAGELKYKNSPAH